jgi:hypothetical protein
MFFVGRQSGQILPMLFLFVAVLAAAGLSVTRSLFIVTRSVDSAEIRFQNEMNLHLQTVYNLNAISENNLLIAKMLSGIVRLYLEGTARALDLAASSPVWERRLPVPDPENVYVTFESALKSARPLLMQLSKQNDTLRLSLPEKTRSTLTRLSNHETLCALSEKYSHPRSFSAHCNITAATSLLAVAKLRQISSLESVSNALGYAGGLTAIHIPSETLLSQYRSESNSDNKPDPFSGLVFSLTHPSFCKTRLERATHRKCLSPPSEEFKEQGPVIHRSVTARWSLRVDE